MLFRLQVLPMAEHRLVGFHLRHGLGPVVSIIPESLYEIIEDQSVGTLCAIFWQHTDQQQVDGIRAMEFKYFQQMPPSERQQSSVTGFSQSLGK